MAFTVVFKQGNKRTYKSAHNDYEVSEGGVLHVTMRNGENDELIGHHYLAPGSWLELADVTDDSGKAAPTVTDS